MGRDSHKSPISMKISKHWPEEHVGDEIDSVHQAPAHERSDELVLTTKLRKCLDVADHRVRTVAYDCLSVLDRAVDILRRGIYARLQEVLVDTGPARFDIAGVEKRERNFRITEP